MRCVSVVCDVGLYDREHVEYVYLSKSMCVCLKCSSETCGRYSCHCGESCRGDPGKAGSSSKWVCCCCGEMSWEDLDSADERRREWGSSMGLYAQQWVAPTYAVMCVFCEAFKRVSSSGDVRVNWHLFSSEYAQSAPGWCAVEDLHAYKKSLRKRWFPENHVEHMIACNSDKLTGYELSKGSKVYYLYFL